MDFVLRVNQKQAVDLGLNLNQAAVFEIIRTHLKKSREFNIKGISYQYIKYKEVSELLPLFRLDSDTVYRHVKALIDVGLLERATLTDRQAFVLLSKGFKDGCNFCGYNEFALDSHHYPIRKSEGGTEVIDLCPNCHRAFHCLTDYGLVRVV